MYQPRRITEAPLAVPEAADGAELAAFRSAPRRAARSRLAATGTKLAPIGLSVALVATISAVALNLREPQQADELIAVPERVDQLSRDAVREPLPQRALAETLSTDEATPEASADADADAEATAAPVAAAWSAQFGTVTGKRYAQAAVVVRAAASGDSAQVAKLAAGDAVSATDMVTNGFRQVVVNKKLGWVADRQLGKSAPKPKVVAKPAAKPAAKASGGTTTYSGPSKLGLKPKAMVVYNAVMAKYNVPSVGGWRASSRSSHQCGLAIDFMTYTNRGLGDAIADYVVANAGTWGVTHVIWKQRIWTPYRPYWRAMADRGSITANHYDHVHVALADRC